MSSPMLSQALSALSLLLIPTISFAAGVEIFEHTAGVEIHLIDSGPGQVQMLFQATQSQGTKQLVNALAKGTCEIATSLDRKCNFQLTTTEERIEAEIQFVFQAANNTYQFIFHQDFFDPLTGSFIDFKHDEIPGFTKSTHLMPATNLPALLIGDFRKKGDDLVEIRFLPEAIAGQYSLLFSWQDLFGRIDKETYSAVACFGQADQTTLCLINELQTLGTLTELIFTHDPSTGTAKGIASEVTLDPSSLEYKSADSEFADGWTWANPI